MSGVILVLLFLVALAKGQITIGGTIVLNYRKISTPFNNPIGIDYCETSNTLLLTNNYPTGVGGNFRIIYFDGTQKPFSSQEGLTEEVQKRCTNLHLS